MQPVTIKETNMNYTRFMHPADQICFIMKRIYDQGLTTLTGGNLSVMDSEGVMWVSPTGIDKSSLVRDDIVRVYPNGQIEGKHRPTSEYRIHKRIYEVQPEIKAIVHAHPPALVAMSAAHMLPAPMLTLGTYKAFPKIGLAQYAMAGTLRLVDCVGEAFEKGHDAAILKNHAAFLGSPIDLFDACRRFEQMEFAAHMQMNALALGDIKLADEELLEAFKDTTVSCKTIKIDSFCTAELEMRRELAALAKRAYGKKLFTGMEGTISGRISDKAFIISPQEKDNAYITEKDFVHVEDESYELGKMPDFNWVLHQEIYKKHPKVKSVITAAPVTAGAYAVCDKHFDVKIIPESYGVLRDTVRLNTKQFFYEKETVASCFDHDFPLCIIDNVGLLIAGPTPVLTFDKLEVAEATAQSLQSAHISGIKIIPMTKEQQIEADELG